MNFFFYPSDEDDFKKQAIGNYVRTIIFNTDKNEIVDCYARKVASYWTQSCKNNIQSDHRIKEISKNKIIAEIEVYSWIVTSKNDLSIPNFSKQ